MKIPKNAKPPYRNTVKKIFVTVTYFSHSNHLETPLFNIANSRNLKTTTILEKNHPQVAKKSTDFFTSHPTKHNRSSWVLRPT